MTNEQRVRLWDLINTYAQSCGGDPSKHVYGNTMRQQTVAEIEREVRNIIEDAMERSARWTDAASKAIRAEKLGHEQAT